ncbi:MAG: hypothetical protein ACR2NS_10165 [Gemmatimonadaceae bacterium]
MTVVGVIGFVAVAIAVSSSPSRGQARDSTVVRRQLLAIEQEIARANRECDYGYFDRIEAAEFLFSRTGTGRCSTLAPSRHSSIARDTEGHDRIGSPMYSCGAPGAGSSWQGIHRASNRHPFK